MRTPHLHTHTDTHIHTAHSKDIQKQRQQDMEQGSRAEQPRTFEVSCATRDTPPVVNHSVHDLQLKRSAQLDQINMSILPITNVLELKSISFP